MNLDSCSEFWGNLGEFLGNPGEIPHVGGKSVGSIGLITFFLLIFSVQQHPLSTINIQYGHLHIILV